MKRFITQQEIETLKSLIGSNVRYIGGPYMPEYMLAADVVLATDAGAIELFGETDSLEFQGYLDDFSYFVIKNASPKLLIQTEGSGNIYKQFSGRRILDVKVLVEHVVASQAGKVFWSDRSAVALLIVLDRGVMSISKMSHHGELLQITELSQGDFVKEVPDVSLRFDDDLIKSHSISRSVLNLDELKAIAE
jgi:hypothetical protein